MSTVTDGNRGKASSALAGHSTQAWTVAIGLMPSYVSFLLAIVQPHCRGHAQSAGPPR
ncbi:hypothetical protein LX32DRAFT_636750 [Colletotrichum zoysiae]|uniref:Uncharacterized protein n=1 Tax=Colletotrichum zoysiae TaxID=1216348 RepID=A0AAD9HN30_9PEZI|nr:hypothetical protein LX32DRAFT_636750 [Colletotrichum zoysiae]